MAEIFQKEGITGQWLGQEFAKVVAKASARGVTAVAIGIQKRATLGMKFAQNNVERKITTGRRKRGVPGLVGLEYHVGQGSALGGYPGKRTGTLERSMGFVPARVSKRPRALVTADAKYARYVHSYMDGRDKRPYLLLPVRNSRTFLRNQFIKVFKETLTTAGMQF